MFDYTAADNFFPDRNQRSWFSQRRQWPGTFMYKELLSRLQQMPDHVWSQKHQQHGVMIGGSCDMMTTVASSHWLSPIFFINFIVVFPRLPRVCVLYNIIYIYIKKTCMYYMYIYICTCSAAPVSIQSGCDSSPQNPKSCG